MNLPSDIKTMENLPQQNARKFKPMFWIGISVAAISIIIFGYVAQMAGAGAIMLFLILAPCFALGLILMGFGVASGNSLSKRTAWVVGILVIIFFALLIIFSNSCGDPVFFGKYQSICLLGS